MNGTPISPLSVLNTMFQTMQSIGNNLAGTFISEGYSILETLGLIMSTWLVLNWVLSGGLPEIMSKGLSILIKAAVVMFLLSGWTTTTRNFFVNNMEQVATKVSGGTAPNAQNVLLTVWNGAMGLFQTTRNTASNPCTTVTGAAAPEAPDVSGGVVASMGCNSTAAPTQESTFSGLFAFVKNFPLIVLTLVFKIIAAIALLAMGGVFVLVVQTGSILLSIAFILGPLFIPWYLLPPTEFLFNGWLKFTIVAGLYKVVAWLLVTIVIGGALPGLTTLLQSVGTAYLTYMAVAFVCCLGVYLMRMAPAIANGLVSGQARIDLSSFGSGYVSGAVKAFGKATRPS